MRNYYVAGDWNALCDRCSFKFKASSLQTEWTGLKVCEQCFETRHPQTLIRVPEEKITTPWARPGPDNTYYTVNWTAVGTGILSPPFSVAAPANTDYAPRKLGDVNNDGAANSADALAMLRYAAGGASNTQQQNAYCRWLEQYLISDPVTYAAFLTLNTYTS